MLDKNNPVKFHGQGHVLAVNEIYGATFQGEGASLGMPCYFLRLGGCNLACVWCDTPYTWDWKRFNPRTEIHPMTVQQVWDEIEKLSSKSRIRNLVISGGEPMLQVAGLAPLINLLLARGWWVEIETNGTVLLPAGFQVSRLNVSLKLENSGNEYDKRRVPEAIETYARSDKSIFKFVVGDEKDFEEIETIIGRYSIHHTSVYIMPEGKQASEVESHSQMIMEKAIAMGYNVTTRLHILVYGSKRGV